MKQIITSLIVILAFVSCTKTDIESFFKGKKHKSDTLYQNYDTTIISPFSTFNYTFQTTLQIPEFKPNKGTLLKTNWSAKNYYISNTILHNLSPDTTVFLFFFPMEY